MTEKSAGVPSRITSVIVMELAIKTLEEYWDENVARYKRLQYPLVQELVILKVLKQIAAAIQEVHERGTLFSQDDIDKKCLRNFENFNYEARTLCKI